MEQLCHTNIHNVACTFPLVVIGENLRTPQNVGMSIRISEAFGVETFYLNANSPDLSNKLVQRTARNTEKNLNILKYDKITSLLTRLKAENYYIIALEVTQNSENIQTYNFRTHDKMALLIGSERFGIPEEALAICHKSIHIPMHGLNSSMNVVNSLGIGLYELTKQLKNNDTFS